MADVALAEDIKDLKGKYDEVEDRLDGHASSLDRIIKWALEGNGDSAETRLKTMEGEMTAVKACVEKAIAPEHISLIAKEAAKAVVTNARDKDRTVVSKIKAFAPYFAALCAVVIALLKVFM